ncbi:hypothetical protein [Paenibacillus sp. UNC496MF]|uniref:hypothetical protein n=1 Tax=Paenibacillus sp. UNC496MF TaxID=1502753 RepID=UPI001160A12C|nr:hypothetical protein [Paenibacillus sp. UNC496MF]
MNARQRSAAHPGWERRASFCCFAVLLLCCFAVWLLCCLAALLLGYFYAFLQLLLMPLER